MKAINSQRSPIDPEDNEYYQQQQSNGHNYFEEEYYNDDEEESDHDEFEKSPDEYLGNVYEEQNEYYGDDGLMCLNEEDDDYRDDEGYFPQQQEDKVEEDEEEEEEPPSVNSAVSGDDAALDLAELEQLQEEAERMKGLGNKHMAAQEYTRAYNAYSAALQLSPVGPSSHVFLSNRAASLLSLKRYSAAAVDARRAVALAPTFGKAHARLGQALYFLKQYQGAVEAYEDALRYEEEGGGSNQAVTRAYLNKAKEKLALQEEKERRKAALVADGADDGATIGETVGEESALQTVAYSVVTDKEGRGVASGQMNSQRLVQVAKEENKVMSSIVEDREQEEGPGRITPSSPPNDADRPTSPSIMYVETGPMGGPAQRRVEPKRDLPQARAVDDAVLPPEHDNRGDEPDPDFDEALRLQRRATQFLSHKRYRQAVDDFSAALFLVPDDPILTPQLHVGRAHALNGQERFESAKNDALMALRHILRTGEEDVSAAEAYSVLGKSLYYTKDYQGAIEALEECDRVWKLNGGKLSVFDEAYLEQCHEALDAGLGVDQGDGASVGGGASVVSNGVKSVVSTLKEGKPLTNIPKLKPPRFVSREQALQNAHNIRPMPKSWPQQSPTSPSSIATGPERPVIFLSDAMGIKLNRGNDGLIRVISVADLPPGSPILRKGKIQTGDLIREAGGVDLRRPITATMWGDTVALIKMAPRPLTLIVAKEITSDLRNGSGNHSPRVTQQKFDYSSAAVGEESVADSILAMAAREQHGLNDWEDVMRETGIIPPSRASGEEAVNTLSNQTDSDETENANISSLDDMQDSTPEQQPEPVASNDTAGEKCEATSEFADTNPEERLQPPPPVDNQNTDGDELAATNNPIESNDTLSTNDSEPPAEENHTGIDFDETTDGPKPPKEILFDDRIFTIQALDDGSEEAKSKLQGWTNKKWAAIKPSLLFAGPVTRLILEKKMFWSTECYAKRILAIFSLKTMTEATSSSDKSHVILILRKPTDVEEVVRLLPIKNDSNPLPNKEMTQLLDSFLVAESVVDPLTCKLRLSQLTTPTSIPFDSSSSKKRDNRKPTFFELLTPNGSICLSAVPISEQGKQDDSGAGYDVDSIVKTAKYEDAITNALLAGHSLVDGLKDVDRAGAHQIILGTLHSYVLSGNDKLLQDALSTALQIQKSSTLDAEDVVKLDSSIIDARDLNWKTPLHYACERKRSTTISLLINAGANCIIPTSDAYSPLHLCAERLDDKGLSIILSATHPTRPDPNALDSLGRTPMYLAAIRGNDGALLARCLSALNAWGGQFLPARETVDSKKLLHPIHRLSLDWKFEQLSMVLSYVNYHFPLTGSEMGGISLGGKFGYPIHAAVISLRHQMFNAFNNNSMDFFGSVGIDIAKTIQTLVDHGFEPNERFEGIVGEGEDIKSLHHYFGFTPLQIVAETAIELRSIDTQKQETGVNDISTMNLIRQVLDMVQSASDALLRNGARTNLDAPPETRLDRDTPPGCFSYSESLELPNETISIPPISRKGPKADSDIVTSLLGGNKRVQASQKSFKEMLKCTNSTTNGRSVQVDAVADSKLPGGSDSNSCAICWSEFGLISNRKQFCQVSTRYVCNDCSTKRLVESGRDIRISDGQFLAAKAIEAKRTSSNNSKPSSVAKKNEPEPRRESNRLKLGLFSRSASSDTRIDEASQSTEETITSAALGLNRTRDAVLERGDKLQGLAEKTEALSQASLDFANMAKELNKQQSSFW